MTTQFAGNATAVSLLASVDAANTAAATGAWVDVRDYEGPALVVQNAGLGTGTLTGKLQHADDGSGTNAEDLTGAAFVEKTTAANQQKLAFIPNRTRGFVRYVGTVGTGPQQVAATLVAVKKTAP